MSSSVSVAMATYNGERFIAEQLHSLATQSLRPLELVVSDDASVDSTVGIVRAFARSAPFPVHIHVNDQPLGVNDNFLQAIGFCQGSLIATCDQDDVWSNDKLARCDQALRDPDVQLVIHSALCVDESLTPTGNYFPRFRSPYRTTRLRPIPGCKSPGSQWFSRVLSYRW